ncbi:gibberellin 20 oxidase 1-D-like [Silene latifolia]|uniref:gibberellin 20 oxidase 1-D-like n=1 Tax=Silene latifolia TaxID=37657 RepID=UPI003D76A72B
MHYEHNNCLNGQIAFDLSTMQTQPHFPKEFLWTKGEIHSIKPNNFEENHVLELNEPLIDLDGFFKGDQESIKNAAALINKACTSHGFFQVTNHGVDSNLIQEAEKELDSLFKLPLEKKLRVQRKAGDLYGYSGAHTDRFSKQLPWKETFSLAYNYRDQRAIIGSHRTPSVVDYVTSTLGEEFEHTGWVYQKYCEAMKKLSLAIFELLAISLGIERSHYRRFFEDGSSILRCNSYPKCKEPGLTYGTGPHCDPTSLTILHQDQVGGLEVFANNKWQAVRPKQDALVINIGDTFMALSNGRYKSCMHRAMVNKDKERRSLAFFVNPAEDKVVRPPHDLLVPRDEGTFCRTYPDFKWSHLLEFTQKHYRSDLTTLHNFFLWLPSSKFGLPLS